ncbi:CBS domain-containing protein [Candidatus Woesearchaeota archaeon]|nr:MAG: CBS domain-containing protein [Candidatus Woesearchaeota archaeon]
MRTGYVVEDFMTNKPVTVTKDTSLKETSNVMKKHDVNSVIIADGQNLLGIITDEDIVRKLVALGLNPETVTAEQIMEKNMVTTQRKKDLYEAMIIMRDNDIRHLPVVEQGKLYGFITMKDILKIQPELFDILSDKYAMRNSFIKVKKQVRSELI